MQVVAVTGVSGRLGQAVLRHLAADPDVTRVIGVDVREPAYRPTKLSFHRLDVASTGLKPVLEGVDALLHLAFLFAPPQDDELAARINVGGTRRVLDAAGAAGVTSVVYVSSAMAYGAWPDNPVPLTEETPLRPNPGFAYGSQKAEAERLVQEWAEDHPAAVAAVLRPTTMVGPGVDTWLTTVLAGPPPLRIRDASPPVQYVHEVDVASAAHLAMTKRLRGVFNVAPTGWIGGEDALALKGGARLPSVGESVARRISGWASTLGFSDVPPEFLAYLMHPWVVANDRLRDAGWMPQYTNEEALVSGVRPSWWQSLGPQRRQAITLGGMASAAAGSAAAGVVLWRRRRR